jgi:membrane protease YdiL (CAAX protease family)
MTSKPDARGALLRVGLYLVLGFVSLKIFATLVAILVGDNSPALGFVGSAMAVFAAAALANAIAIRIYERGRLSDVGMDWNPRALGEFWRGTALCGGAAAAILVGAYAAGAAKFEAVQGAEHRWAAVAFVAAVLLFGAAGEEILFRGYAFQLLVRIIGPWATILPISVLFAFMHIDNPGIKLLGLINTMLFGMLFGYAYVRTGSLWAPIGMHFGWNLALELFGVNLSGFTMGVSGFTLRWKTGDLWSGGAYGPEGSLVTTVVVIVLFVVLQRVIPGEAEVRS